MASTHSSQNAFISDTWGMPPIAVRLAESFEDVVAKNPELRIEQAANGEVIFLSPTGGESGKRNANIIVQLGHWAISHGGAAFDSSTLFCLPNGAKRSPDAAWISADRWQALTDAERKAYPPLSPDFVIELRSESDRLVDLQEKMEEYMNNGVRLGWLIDPLLKQVHIYKPGQTPEMRHAPESLTEETCLPGFLLDLRQIWTV